MVWHIYRIFSLKRPKREVWSQEALDFVFSRPYIKVSLTRFVTF